MRGRSTWWAAAAGALVLGGAGAAGAQSAAPPPPCAAAADAQRTAWRVTGPPIAQPALAPGAVLRHWPTASPGVWVVEDASAGSLSLTRVAPDGLTRVTWSRDCEPSRSDAARPAAPAPAFTDADLAAALAAAPRGVLYVWSPHMPLSVDGYAEVVRAAQAHGLAVQALLDPHANRAVAAEIAEARGLPRQALRVVDAVELQFRELALHAPSLALFADGRIVGSVLRGYRTADEYAAFFDRELARR